MVKKNPDHPWISKFRRKHLNEVGDLFLQVFHICQGMGLVELGNAALERDILAANEQDETEPVPASEQ